MKEEYMFMPSNAYCGDTTLRESLEKCGSKRTLYEVYGLFYGCIAAPHAVNPSGYLDIILGREDRKPFESLDDANMTLGNIMSLWNLIASWNPEQGVYVYPDMEYPETLDGLKQNIQGHLAFINFFIKGLDLGGLQEADLIEDVKLAFKDLATASTVQEKLLELLEREKTAKESDVAESRNNVSRLEEVMIHCIARINAGLRESRIAASRGMRRPRILGEKPAPVRTDKIYRNQFCPCGSGKKYKKCCAGTHKR
jgi:hypothetical protein